MHVSSGMTSTSHAVIGANGHSQNGLAVNGFGGHGGQPIAVIKRMDSPKKVLQFVALGTEMTANRKSQHLYFRRDVLNCCGAITV